MTVCIRCGKGIHPNPVYPKHPWAHDKWGWLTCFNGFTRDWAAPAPEPEEETP